MLLAGMVAGGIPGSSLNPQTVTMTTPPAQPASSAAPLKSSTTAPSSTSVRSVSHSRYHPNPVSKRASEYYPLIWGVDSFRVKAVESGELIRFSYRIVDSSKATVFNDKKIDAFLDSPRARVRLVVPSLEKVGQLRQYNNPEAGKSYWMAFSNPRLTVKRGDHVNVVIGRFHADGLIVE
jgi:hypothetical protein